MITEAYKAYKSRDFRDFLIEKLRSRFEDVKVLKFHKFESKEELISEEKCN
jgi:hypothetical protein